MTEDIINLLLQSAAATKQLTEAALAAAQDLQLNRKEYEWVKPSEAASMLGSAFTSTKIVDDINAGIFKYKRDYINTSNGSRPSYAVKVAQLRKVYELPPEKRQSYPIPASQDAPTPAETETH